MHSLRRSSLQQPCEMSPKLKPLILPQLVEERRKLEVQKGNDGFNTSHLVYPTSSSSSSDVASPVTPTFPRGHLRYSSSTSSLEMTLPASVYNDLPASPTQPSHSKTAANKRLLPDVQEEPLERDEDDTVVSLHLGLYDSLRMFSPAIAPATATNTPSQLTSPTSTATRT